MTWVKLGDEFSGGAEPLTDAAFRLHVEALAWSARNLLDLQVPFRHLPRFAYCGDPETAAKELVEAGWWEERGDGWFIGLRWPEWQRDKAEVERERARALERQHRRRKHLADDHSDCRPEHCEQVRPQASGVESTESRRDERRESRGPDPTRPDPKGSGRVEGAYALSRRDTRRKRKPTRDDADTAIDLMSDRRRQLLRTRAVELLLAEDGLHEGWEQDEGHQWEPYIAGRMRKLTLEDLTRDWEAEGERRTGT